MPLLRAASYYFHTWWKSWVNEVPAVTGTYLLPHLADELMVVKHTTMTYASENNRRLSCSLKFAPFRTSWTDIVRRGTFTLRGVRNPQARNNLAAMKMDDLVLHYHSQQELAIVGIMKVSKEAYPDPTSTDPQWLTCDFRPVITLPQPVTLAQIKRVPELANLPLVKQSRLAVMPITRVQFRPIIEMANTRHFVLLKESI